MADIRPIKAWRYNEHLIERIDELTSPLFDVVSRKQRETLYKEELNSIHLSVPANESANTQVGDLVAQWKHRGILVQDKVPALYVYYQYFRFPGSSRDFVRKGFIANLRIYNWDEQVLLRHENTMPFSVEDRMEVLARTEMNMAPTHGLYTDPGKEIEHYLDEAMRSPLYETEDYQGVRDVLAVIHDMKVIQRIQEIIRKKQVILADGHHRYESSLLYKKQREDANPNHTGEEGYNFHMMYFTNTESDDLRILPTHRIVNGLENFNKPELLEKLSEYFNFKPIENPVDAYEIILGKQWAYGLILKDEAIKLRLKEGMIDQLSWNFPPAIKELELTVMHYFIFEKVLGIPGKIQRDSKLFSFERNFSECIRKVTTGEAQMALITQDISIDTIKEVCYSGYTLPQKSTYFYPKVICGFLFSSIREDEFHSPFDEMFR